MVCERYLNKALRKKSTLTITSAIKQKRQFIYYASMIIIPQTDNTALLKDKRMQLLIQKNSKNRSAENFFLDNDFLAISEC